MSCLELYFLGAPLITLDGESVTIGRQKAVALLAYLEVTQRAHTRDSLATLFWPEYNQKSARGGLRSALHSLKRVLGEGWLEVDREMVGLEPDMDPSMGSGRVVWSDVRAFEDLLAECRTHPHPHDQTCSRCLPRLAEAAKQYRDDFLAGFTLPDCPAFDEWQFFQTEGLREAFAGVLERLTRWHGNVGECETAIEYARRWLTVEPFHEQVHTLLMRLYAQSGSRAAAVRQYEECTRILREEFAAEPSDETVALYERIRAGHLETVAPDGDHRPAIAETDEVDVCRARGYELRERVRREDTGDIYHAYQLAAEREVAVKVILSQCARHPEFGARFDKESQLVSRLEHPHIVPLYDFWRQAGGAYTVMRWLPGGDLYQALQDGAWVTEDAMRLLDQIAGALAVVHRSGMVHRDIKPENISLDEKGNAYLTNFGIAKDLLFPSKTTGADNLPGLPLYIAPEQMKGQPPTVQGDIYSLGMVMYEVLTGQHPYAGLTSADQLLRRLRDPLPPLQEHRPDLPSELDEVIRDATAVDPTQRYSDVQSFSIAFRETIAGRSMAPAPKAGALTAVSATGIPAFLAEKTEAVEMMTPVFVARRRELAQLSHYLDEALARLGRLVFVTGGPGRGKTALAWEFARRAAEKHPALLIASGNCNAYSGVGDPYLPFREVMGILTGDVEARYAARSITCEQAQRLWDATPFTIKTLLDYGPHLTDVFVQGDALLSRAAAVAPESASWLEDLRDALARHRASLKDLDQTHLFQQVTNVLREMAEIHPLLLILDDLQWADNASVGLLFHVGRRLQGTRILVVGAYRPEEVALGRDMARHPLEKVLNEFKRTYGDVWVELDEADEATGQEFVTSFLETEPNCLGDDFARELFKLTRGHPLFTIELLRAMQERGDLAQDELGRWIASTTLDWGKLPARVEGVIEERIGRLEEELREILSVASVEGEDFTVQVVARVQEISERKLFRKLSRELEKRHRLVREKGTISAGQQWFSRYRFTHALVQQYLYNNLGEGERALLHREIGGVLEELYRGHTDEIAVQLAHHYAGNPERERIYAEMAAQRAAAQYANEEALYYLSRALELTPERETQKRWDLLLAREMLNDLVGDREAQVHDLRCLEELSDKLNDVALRTKVALRRANFFEATDDFSAVIEAAEKAICMAQVAHDPYSEALGYLLWGGGLVRRGEYTEARARLGRSLELAQGAQTSMSCSRNICQLEAEILRKLGEVELDQSEYAAARTFHDRALAIHREIGDRRGEGRALNNLGLVCLYEGDVSGAEAFYERALPIQHKVGDRRGESRTLNNLGVLAIERADYIRGGNYYEQALGIFREIGDRRGEAATLANLGEVFLHRGEYSHAKDFCEQALHIVTTIGERLIESHVLTYIGEIALALGDFESARFHFEQCRELNRDIAHGRLEGRVLCGLSLLSHHLGNDSAALEYIQQALMTARKLGDCTVEGHALTAMGHALLDLQRPPGKAYDHLVEAKNVYEEALSIRRKLGQENLAQEPLAGLARIAMVHNDPKQAQVYVEAILSYLKAGSLDGTYEPFRIYLTCYRVLHDNGDPRASEILKITHRMLQERAARIKDTDLRRSFLENVAPHRAIADAWKEAQQTRDCC